MRWSKQHHDHFHNREMVMLQSQDQDDKTSWII